MAAFKAKQLVLHKYLSASKSKPFEVKYFFVISRYCNFYDCSIELKRADKKWSLGNLFEDFTKGL